MSTGDELAGRVRKALVEAGVTAAVVARDEVAGRFVQLPRGKSRDAAEADLARHQAEIDRLVAPVLGFFPPFAIAHQLERSVTWFIQNVAGRPQQPHDEALCAAELERLATAVARTWVPDFDPHHLPVLLLPDEGFDPKAAATPPARDPRLGYAPIRQAELFARVREALHRANFESARSLAHMEVSSGPLSQRRRLNRAYAWIYGLANPENPTDAQILTSTYHAHVALLRGLEAYPPMTLHALAWAGAAFCRARFPVSDARLSLRSEGFQWGRAGFIRAVVAYVLTRLREAIDVAFPGVRGVVVGTPEDPGAGAAPRGVYRRAAPRVADAGASRPDLFSRMDDRGVGVRLDCALAHGTIVGSMAHGHWMSRAFDDAAAEPRHKWHAVVVQRLASEAYDAAASAVEDDLAFRVAYESSIAWAAILCVRAEIIPARRLVSVLRGTEAVVAALDRLGAALGNALGLRGGVDELAVAVRDAALAPSHTPTSPFDELVAGLAIDIGRTLQWSGARAPRAVARALETALRKRPTAHLYYSLWDVRDVVLTMRPTIDSFLGTPGLLGRDEALSAISSWAARAAQTLGVAPGVGDIVEQYAVAKLVG